MLFSNINIKLALHLEFVFSRFFFPNDEMQKIVSDLRSYTFKDNPVILYTAPNFLRQKFHHFISHAHEAGTQQTVFSY